MITAALLSAFVGGLVGSAHCASMCGPIVALFERESIAGESMSPWLRRGCYQLGRLAFYALLGACGALLGIAASQPLGISAATLTLRIAAALVLLLVGLRLAFDWRALDLFERLGARLWRRISPLARFVLPMSSAPRALGAGFVWGALPCGLVYSMAALAATTGSALAGAAVMAAFWAGTSPLLVGAAGIARRTQIEPRFRRLAGGALAAAGLIAILTLVPWAPGDGAGPHHHHGTAVDSASLPAVHSPVHDV